jgi:hypothetical protein
MSMMRHLLTFFLISFFTIGGYAQPLNSIYYEDFTSATKDWLTGSNDTRILSISNGKYHFEHLKNDGAFGSWRNVTIETYADFTIETSITKEAGVQNYGYGLIWGKKDWKNYNRFLLSGNGMFSITRTEKGNSKDLKPWTKSTAIKTGNGATNKLAIKRQGNDLKFYINDVLVHSMPFQTFFDHQIGYYVAHDQKIGVDYISVSAAYRTEKYVLNDDFSDNPNQWSTGDDDKRKLQMTEDGYYSFQHKRSESSWATWNKAVLDDSRDFKIEFAARKASGVQTYGYGLEFGRKDKDNSYLYLISGDGHFMTAEYRAGKYSELKPWTESDLILSGNDQYNQFTVLKTGSSLQYFINGVLVHRTAFPPLFGDRIGFQIYNNQKIDFDYLKVAYITTKGGSTQPISENDSKEPVKGEPVGLPPILTISDITFSENALDAEETAQLSITLKNVGPGDAKNVTANLTGFLKGLNFPTKTSFPTIPANGGEKTVTINIKGGLDLPSSEALLKIEVEEPNFKVKIQGKQLRFPTRAFRSPELILAQYAVLENQSAAPNRQIDINEMIDLKFAVQNVGQGEAENVEVVVENNQKGVMLLGVPDGNQLTRQDPRFSQIESGKFKTVIYRYFVNSEFTDPELKFTIRTKERVGQFGFTETKTFPINTTLSEEGFIRNVATPDDERPNEVIVEDIPDFVVDVDVDIPTNSIEQSTTYALIIGNEDYKSKQRSLKSEQNVDFARNDAEVFALYCEKTLGIPPKQIKLITDATAAEIGQGLAWINNLAKIEGGKAKLLFYYSGHGLPEENSREPYLMPVDVSGGNLRYAIKLSEVYEQLTQHPAEKVTVFLDACFSGGARNAPLVAVKGVRVRPKPSYLKQNLVVFASSTGDESSGVYREKRHGYFTYFLLKKLKDTKGQVPLGELNEYIKRSVSKETGLAGKVQTPQLTASEKVVNVWKSWSLIK